MFSQDDLSQEPECPASALSLFEATAGPFSSIASTESMPHADADYSSSGILIRHADPD